MITVTSIEQGALSLLGTVVLAVFVQAGLLLQAWLKSKGIAVSMDNYDAGLKAVLGGAITAAMGKIQANGWDHIPTQNAIVAAAGSAMVAKFPAVLKDVGLTPELGDEKIMASVTAALAARLPAAMLAASASPATPNTPLQAAQLAATKAA